MTENEAIKRVEEFGLYHAIGDLPHSTLTVKAFEIAIKALQEIQQYRAIGTVEECRKAMERQRAKKPISNNDERKIYMCQCGSTRICTMDNFCPICGQAISWECDTE